MSNKLIPGYGLLATVALALLGALLPGDTSSFYTVLAYFFIIFSIWGGILLVNNK